jgi:hypothetical protein
LLTKHPHAYGIHLRLTFYRRQAKKRSRIKLVKKAGRTCLHGIEARHMTAMRPANRRSLSPHGTAATLIDPRDGWPVAFAATSTYLLVTQSVPNRRIAKNRGQAMG